MKAFLQRHWPLLVALAGLFLSVWVLAIISLQHTNGKLIYPLDDTYIHMAMARNLAMHGVWGVTPDGFTSSSSSPLWTLLIAGAYALVGVSNASPLVFALVSACLVLLVAHWILHALETPPVVTLVTLAALVLLTPLLPLVFIGMEHALHTALTLAATFLAARCLATSGDQRQGAGYGMLLVLAPLLTALRFEAAFLIPVICLGFFLQRQWKRGLLLGALGLAPLVTYAAISHSHGWPWFPTSVILKSGFAAAGNPKLLVADLLERAFQNILGGLHLVALLLLALLLDRIGGRANGFFKSTERVMTGIFVATGVLHLAFARVGWFYRYEAYLVASGILVIGCHFKVLQKVLDVSPPTKTRLETNLARGGTVLVLILALFLCSVRGAIALQNTPQAANNIYEQQYSMARFVERYYQDSTVVLNDVGAVNYFAEIHCFDIWGLATLDVARLRMRGVYRREDIARLAEAHGARIAMVYDSWYEKMGGVPVGWVKVGQWQIQRNVVAGDDTVSIYAIAPGENDLLMRRLAEFSTELPADVVQSGLYVQPVHSDGWPELD